MKDVYKKTTKKYISFKYQKHNTIYMRYQYGSDM